MKQSLLFVLGLIILFPLFLFLSATSDRHKPVGVEKMCVSFCKLYEKEVKHFDADKMECSCEE